jgi:hypothetical protein
LVVQWRQRRTQNIKAGNLALALLVETLNGYLSVRKSAFRMRELVLQVAPKAPLWMHFKPMTHAYETDLSFDFSTLAFLFDRYGASTVQKLSLAASSYRSVARLIDAHRDTAELIQKGMADLGIKPTTIISAEDIEPKIGFNIIAKANGLTTALTKHFQEDERIYEDAFQFLRSELVRRYGNKFVNIATNEDTPMGEDESKERQRLYERTRDELHAISKSISESYDRALLTLASAFLGGSLAFIKEIVHLPSASARWLLYASWLSFAITIVLTLSSFIYGLFTLETLRKAAERYYINKEQTAWNVSARVQRWILLFVIAGGISFILGIAFSGVFVYINIQ